MGPGQPVLVLDLVGNPACAGGGLEPDDLGGPFQSEPFYDMLLD